MKKFSILLAALILFTVHPVFAAIVDIRDGGVHTINNTVYQNDQVYLDYPGDGFTPPDPGTHLNIVNGADILYVEAWNNSTIDMTGGFIYYGISALGNSKVSISGGDVWDIQAVQDSEITISGGIFNSFSAYINGTIKLVGTDFAVDGTPVSAGDKLSDFGTFVENGTQDYYTGTITGTLEDGSSLDNTFFIYNTGDYAGTGDIFIVPEPATLTLLGLGGLLFRKRKA